MNYHLRELKKHIIISSTSYISPLQELLELASELKRKQYSGEVLFDLLCTNGNNPNRFISIFFNGSNFENKSVKALDKPSMFIINEQSDFYSNNQEFICNSVLSSIQQEKFICEKTPNKSNHVDPKLSPIFMLR